MIAKESLYMIKGNTHNGLFQFFWVVQRTETPPNKPIQPNVFFSSLEKPAMQHQVCQWTSGDQWHTRAYAQFGGTTHLNQPRCFFSCPCEAFLSDPPACKTRGISSASTKKAEALKTMGHTSWNMQKHLSESEQQEWPTGHLHKMSHNQYVI